MRLVAGPRFLMPPRLRGGTRALNLCSRCPMLEECKECVADGRLLACEAADERDAMGVRLQ